MKLSIIIVNYNVQHFLEQALLAVQKAMQGLESEIFVVDNNSMDQSVQMVRKKFPEVHLIDNKHNPGFSKANNQAIRLAKGKYILLLNPDTVIAEDTLRKCVDFMESHPDAGGLGVKMIDGGGNFLPESKRGFPSPWAAFCKTFGLSRFFPTSPLFNNYHLGYLDKNKTHEVDVLSGAYMLMRKNMLDKIGLLDEAFFMYGEDIDLSYRIQKGGYKNYYFADTSIIHYKGESTKKGSLNYVRVFYQAMIIFAKKHFQGQRARGFVWMLQGAIFFRALLTILGNTSKKAFLPFLDAAIIFGGLVWLQDFWAVHYWDNSDYFQPAFFYFNIPLYITVWLGTVYFNGGYDTPFHLQRLTRGLIIGSIILAAIYGFLPLELRPSRAILLLGAIGALLSTVSLRTIIHFIKFGNFNVGQKRVKNLIIVGSKSESMRIQALLQQASVQKNFIGVVSPQNTTDLNTFLGGFPMLKKIIHLYQIDEIIFCAQDISNQSIINQMIEFGSRIEYRIVPKASESIIGSNSKNEAGELYTADIQFNIAAEVAQRNKRVFDFFTATIFILLSPILLFFIKRKFGFFKNTLHVLLGKKTWVGYEKTQQAQTKLPKIKTSIFTPLDALEIKKIAPETIQRLNFLYAKDWQLWKEVQIMCKNLPNLGKIG